MKQTLETPELDVTIRLADDDAAKNLTPEQQQEFEAQVSQADPQRILEIVRQTVEGLNAEPEKNKSPAG